MSPNFASQPTWPDANMSDAETENMINSILSDTVDVSANMDSNDHADDDDAFPSAWAGSASDSLGANASHFGFSPSQPLGVSPSIASHYQTDFTSKPNHAWSLPSDLPTTILSAGSNLDNMYSSLSDGMLPSLSNSTSLTSNDAPGLPTDIAQPLGSHPSTSLPVDDMVVYTHTTSKDLASTSHFGPSGLAAQPSPLVPNTTLTGYHSNIATDHAAHLADLVKASNLINAGHPGPRSLASSLSRSVLNADAIGRPDASTFASGHTHQKSLTIQQRRRLSHMAKTSPPNVGSTATLDAPHSPDKTRRRQNSAPGPPLPPYASSPEMPNTPLTPSRRRSFRAPTSVQPSLPASIDDVDSWMDAVVAHSHDLVFVLSLKGTVLYMSPSVQRILGFHPEEIIGRPLVDFSHPADIGPFSRELKEAITLPSGDEQDPDAHNTTSVKANRRVDLIMRMARKDGTFSLIETTGRVSVDPPKHRKVVVCSGRPHPVPMLPWNDVRQDLLTTELSAWLKISHNGIFLGGTGPIQQILGIEDVNLLGRHVRDLPMVTSSSDLLDALRSGRCISVQDHYESATSGQKAPVKLTVYPWTSNGRSNSVSFVHVQQQPASALEASSAEQSPASPSRKRKASDHESDASKPVQQQQQSSTGSGSLTGASFQSNGTSVPIMSANDAANTVFAELTGFHSGSWLIEMQRLHHANRKLRHELSALTRRSPKVVSPEATPKVSACS
ncbi:PAS domain-containing protein [Pseudozyma hubeiensis]|nr:PAS domain-containing protein [Pseudozyma hubeiensis]